MQSVLSGIWTRIAVSISNDDNHYNTDTARGISNFADCLIPKPSLNKNNHGTIQIIAGCRD